MIIYVDVNTLALTTEGHVPLTDMALVRGDKVPLRIVLTDGESQEVPVLAVKKSLGNDALVLAATGLERVEDVLGTAYVGSLSVNTTQLATVMGDQDRIELVGEVVLVAPDGAQRTSRLVRVTVRADLLPADYAPPEDVLADWSELVASTLASQLPDALTAAGMHVSPVTGTSTLTTGDADTHTPVALYAITWGDELLAGHLTDSCRLRRVVMTAHAASSSTAPHWLRVLLGMDGNYTQIAVSAPVTAPVAGQPVTWEFAPGVSLRRGDKLMLEICVGVDAGNARRIALDLHAVITPAKDGRGLAADDGYPVVIADGTMAPMMTVSVDYDDGVSVGGTQLATASQVQELGTDVRTAAATAQAAATAAATARNQAQAAATNAGTSATSAATSATAAQQALAAMPQVDAGGNMTLAGGLTVPATVNANGGVNIPVAPATPTHAARLVDVQRSVLASVLHYHPAKALMASTLGTVRDDLRGLGFAAPGSPGRGISAASYQSETSSSYQDLAAVTRITLTRSHWGSTMICLSRSGDISDDTSEPLLSPQAITQFAFNENDPNNVYTIYDSTGGVIIQGTLPRSICDHNIVADFYIVAWHDWIYFYQGSAWANRENKAPGNSFQPPLYLGRAPMTIGPMYSWYLICAKGGNGHQWGQVPAGVLQRIDEFRMDQAGMFFPNLND